MSIRRALFVVPLLLVPAPASAHLHNMSYFYAVSAREGSDLGGGIHLAREWVCSKSYGTRQWRPFSAALDGSLHFPDGSALGTGLGALRFSYGSFPADSLSGVSFSLQALAGVDLRKDVVKSGLVYGFGGGVDVTGRTGNGARLQVDVLFAPDRDGRHASVRVSIGWVRRKD